MSNAVSLPERYENLAKVTSDARVVTSRLINSPGMTARNNKFWFLLGTQLLMLEPDLENEPTTTDWRRLCENRSRLMEMANLLRRDLPSFPASSQADCQRLFGNLTSATNLLTED